MRPTWFALVWVAVVTLAPAAARADDLPTVVSINLCTDQLVMLLANPEQVLALSSLSREKAGSIFFEKAHDYPQVEPLAEHVFPFSPDVVVMGPYTSRYTVNLLGELGMSVETMPLATSIEDMLANVERVGKLLSQQEKAATIIDDVRLRLDEIAKRVYALDSNLRPTMAVYDPNGYTVGEKTVRGQVIKLAGWQNVATRHGIDSYGVLGLEQLISLKPQALLESPYSENTYSRGQMLTRHPAIRASGLDPLIINVPSNQTICAGPWVVDMIEQLLDAQAGYIPQVLK